MECTHALLMIRIGSAFAHAHALECIATDKIALAVTIMAFKNSLSWVLHTSMAQLRTHCISSVEKECETRCKPNIAWWHPVDPR